jgi:hypothetical protein
LRIACCRRSVSPASGQTNTPTCLDGLDGEHLDAAAVVAVPPAGAEEAAPVVLDVVALAPGEALAPAAAELAERAAAVRAAVPGRANDRELDAERLAARLRRADLVPPDAARVHRREEDVRVVRVHAAPAALVARGRRVHDALVAHADERARAVEDRLHEPAAPERGRGAQPRALAALRGQQPRREQDRRAHLPRAPAAPAQRRPRVRVHERGVVRERRARVHERAEVHDDRRRRRRPRAGRPRGMHFAARMRVRWVRRVRVMHVRVRAGRRCRRMDVLVLMLVWVRVRVLVRVLVRVAVVRVHVQVWRGHVAA